MIQFYYLSHNKEVQIVSIKDNQQALNVLSKKVLIEKKIDLPPKLIPDFG